MNELFSKLCCLFLALLFAGAVQAQSNATLSFQGILKKSNGVAVEDGTYAITFNLYDTEQGGTALWTETQPDVEVTSGIYSVLLGTIEPLTIAFDKIYYLGLKVGSSEMTPRFKLTSAPYALSLIGQKNLFPSTGTVKADSLQVEGRITAAGIRARGGAPGLNGVDNNGYAFEGNGGDNDSGLFSTGDGSVSLYANNTERLTVNGNGADVNGDLSLRQNGAVVYNGLKDWRLVDIDDFSTGNDGWRDYNRIGGNGLGTSNVTSSGIERMQFTSPFTSGYAIRPLKSNENLLKKEFDLSGIPHNEIKVVFTYYILGSWDWDQHDWGFAAFQSNPAEKLTLGWIHHTRYFSDFLYFDNQDKYQYSFSLRQEMTGTNSKDKFWVVFGSTLNDDYKNENYAVGSIEIWVR